ncbi:hypothetical protein FA13DRAFT_1734673 [Coprinellus micaceus]|uniref:F-box domain-containing protein n=1 Tax=Coprinellus micaceus TaxID=71717 RepID=A0A4Y7T5P9_COPMI|nr:hypothetical protein FA13DRAFT_1734673 [Coprinellus micaceus]
MPKTRPGKPRWAGASIRRSSIRVIPPELLTLIFEHIELAEPSILASVGLVCRQWKDIIYSNPKFWRSLNCHAHVAPAHNQGLVEFVQRWFGRSNDLLLSFSLEMRPPRPSAFDLRNLTNYLMLTKRWRELSFTLVPTGDNSSELRQFSWPWIKALFNSARAFSKEPGETACWGALESLELIGRELSLFSPGEMPVLALADIAPNVKNLRIVFRRFSSLFNLNSTHINMHNLKRLEIDGEIEWVTPDMLLAFYLRLITEVTQLEELKLLDYYSKLAFPTTFEFASPPIRNATLRRLTLHDGPGVRFFLRGISLPSLDSLAIMKPESGTTTIETLSLPLDESVKQLLDQSGCKLKEFKLENAHISKNGLIGLLPAMEGLETLVLNTAFSNGNDATEFLLRIKEGGGHHGKKVPESRVLPRLRNLSFTVGAFITPKTKFRLQETFKAVVDDVSRWWPQSATSASGADTTLNPEQRVVRLENAQLVMHHIDGASSVLISRGEKREW